MVACCFQGPLETASSPTISASWRMTSGATCCWLCSSKLEALSLDGASLQSAAPVLRPCKNLSVPSVVVHPRAPSPSLRS